MDRERWLAPPVFITGPAGGGGGGGRIKVVPEDFVVEEVPAYPAAGEGDFLFLLVEKVDVSALALMAEVSKRLGVPRGQLGAAGMKDRRAVTRQWLSAPADAERPPEAIDGPVGETGHIRLLAALRHPHKLKTGHLRGNRFEIRLRERDPAGDAALATALEALATRGFPNSFGAQRFGGGETIEHGLALLTGNAGRMSPRLKRLAVSAAQSAFFNHWLAARAADGLLERAVSGDVLEKRDSGGKFICEDPATDTRRILAGELVVTGPLPGSKPSRTRGEARERELAVHDLLGTPPEALKAFGRLGRGTRRAALCWPGEASAARDADGLMARFVLPKGAYATVFLAHVCGGPPLEGPP